MSMTNLNRRHVLAALGAGLIDARHAFAQNSQVIAFRSGESSL
jgi:hypothetical protein